MRRQILTASTVTACVLALTVPMTNAAAARTKAPGPARHVRASSVGSTSLVVSWTNPSSSKFRRTVVRVRRGSSAPSTVHSGSLVSSLGRTKHKITVKHLARGTAYAFAVFAGDGHGHWAQAATLRTGTATAAPTGPRAYEDVSSTVLRWTNPRAGLHRVVVRYAKGAAAPTSTSRGSGARLSSAKASAARLSHLAADTRYAASIFALDRFGHASAPAVVRFTTPAKATTVADGAYEGRAVDETGSPLVNAVVTAWSYDDGASAETRSGVDGTFHVALPPGRWVIYVDGSDAAGGNSDDTGYQFVGDLRSIESGRTMSAGDVVLRPGGLVTARVTDSAGTPLAGAQVYVTAVDPYVESEYGGSFLFSLALDDGVPTTGADGTITLRGMSDDVPLRVCAVASSATAGTGAPASYLNRCSGRSVLPRPGASVAAQTVQLRRGTGGTVTGHVTGAGGAALGRAVVELEDASGADSFFGASAVVAPDGTFRMTNVAPGTYRACASSDSATARSRTGYAPACGRAFTVTVGAPSSADVTLPVGGAISGQALASGGARLAGVSVQVDGKDYGGYARTDATGHYRVVGVPTGSVRVCFDGAGVSSKAVPTGALQRCYAHGAVAVSAGATRTGVDAVLPIGGAISGRALDADGDPVAGVSVFAESVDDSEEDGGDGYGALTDEQGRYVLTGLESGRYVVCAETVDDDFGAGEPRCRSGAVTVRLRATTTGIDVAQPVPAGITVTVVDGSGTPVAGVDAVALAKCPYDCDPDPALDADYGVEVASSQVTDRFGQVVLSGIEPGRYAVCLHAYYGTTASGGSPTGYADTCTARTTTTRFPLTVSAGSLTSVTLTLPAGGVVTGRVRDKHGNAVADAVVHVEGSAADNGLRTSDFSGESAPGGGDDGDFPGGRSGIYGYFGGPLDDSVTADDGTYTVLAVRPGDARVCVDAADATGPSAGGYLNACLPGGGTVAVAAGTATEGVDIALDDGGAVGGTVRASVKGKPGPGLGVVFVYVFPAGSNRPVAYGVTSPDGTWAVRQLATGSYRVCFDGGAIDRAAQCYDRVVWSRTASSSPPAAAKKIAVAAGSRVSGIDGLLAP